MIKLECLQEHRVESPSGTVVYEDGFGYVYEVDEATAEDLLKLTDSVGNPKFRRVVEEGEEEGG